MSSLFLCDLAKVCTLDARYDTIIKRGLKNDLTLTELFKSEQLFFVPKDRVESVLTIVLIIL